MGSADFWIFILHTYTSFEYIHGLGCSERHVGHRRHVFLPHQWDGEGGFKGGLVKAREGSSGIIGLKLRGGEEAARKLWE